MMQRKKDRMCQITLSYWRVVRFLNDQLKKVFTIFSFLHHFRIDHINIDKANLEMNLMKILGIILFINHCKFREKMIDHCLLSRKLSIKRTLIESLSSIYNYKIIPSKMYDKEAASWLLLPTWSFFVVWINRCWDQFFFFLNNQKLYLFMNFSLFWKFIFEEFKVNFKNWPISSVFDEILLLFINLKKNSSKMHVLT